RGRVLRDEPPRRCVVESAPEVVESRAAVVDLPCEHEFIGSARDTVLRSVWDIITTEHLRPCGRRDEPDASQMVLMEVRHRAPHHLCNLQPIRVEPLRHHAGDRKSTRLNPVTWP